MRKNSHSYSSFQTILRSDSHYNLSAAVLPHFDDNELIISNLHQHLDSMPTSYATAALSVVEMLHHKQMLHEVQSNLYRRRLRLLIITRSDGAGVGIATNAADSDSGRLPPPTSPMWMEIHFADRCSDAHSMVLAALQICLGKMHAKVKKIKMYRGKSSTGGAAVFIVRVNLNRNNLAINSPVDWCNLAANLDSRTMESVIEGYCLHAPNCGADFNILSSAKRQRRCCYRCVDVSPPSLRLLSTARYRNGQIPGSGRNDHGHNNSVSAYPAVRLNNVLAEVVRRWSVSMRKEVVLGRRIGAGSCGVVFEGLYDRGDGVERVAVKLIRGSHKAQFRREVLAFAAITPSRSAEGVTSGRGRPALVPFIGAAECADWAASSSLADDDNEAEGKFEYVIVTKFMEGGSLHEYLRRRRWLDLAEALDLAADVAEAVALLHQRGIVHMDVKSPNVFLDKEGRAVVGDLGSARAARERLREELTWRGGDAAGTYRWMAPEVLESSCHGEGDSVTDATSAASEVIVVAAPAMDVYSLGMVMWEVVSGEVPFADMEPLPAAAGVLLRGMRPPIPPRCPAPLACLIRSCWAQQPEARPSAAYVLRMLRHIRANYVGRHTAADDAHLPLLFPLASRTSSHAV